jgi:hypothetical protein
MDKMADSGRVRFVSLGWCLLCGLIGLFARFHNLTEVLVDGRFYFVDADCYSRMTRAERVLREPGTVVRVHEFENWPDGIVSHATAPMDYAIAGLSRVLLPVLALPSRFAVLAPAAIDAAGALVGPLIGVCISALIALWAGGLLDAKGVRCGGWWAAPLLFAVSPALVHATVFGRPDHQSLILACMAVVFAAEERLIRGGPSPNTWAWTGGVGMGLGLWVSLFEPLVILGVILVTGALFWRRSWTVAIRLRWLIGLFVFFAIGLAVDGIHFAAPETQWREALLRWGGTIGELRSLNSFLELSRWCGLAVWAVPLGLWFIVRGEGLEMMGWLALFVCLGVLSVWQIRWGAYFALAVVFAAPWALAAVTSSWTRVFAVLVSMWPVASEWDALCFPKPAAAYAKHLARSERINARRAAERLRSPDIEPFVAPWWHSPSIAYWSGQPAVAGSGHQGIAGIVDTARVYMSTEPAVAREVFARRGVKWVIAADVSQVVQNSAAILGSTPAVESPHAVPLAELLWKPVLSPEWGLEGEQNVTTFRLLRILNEER